MLLLPLYLLIIFISAFTFGKDIFFPQERIGYQQQVFTLFKFRSMSDALGEGGVLLPEALRITRWGKFLRAYSLDELPQLYNVFKGELSLVGPRPLLKAYLPYYTAEEQKRHEVLPGLTGLAQVKGRNLISWQEKFTYDVKYTKNMSFWLDVRIMLLTARHLVASQPFYIPESLVKERELSINAI